MGVTGTIPTAVSSTNSMKRIAGEPIVAYQAVYLDGEFTKKADASDQAKMPAAGVIITAAVINQEMDVWYRGTITNSGWNLTSGAPIFVLSGGGIGHNLPEVSGFVVQVMGKALTKTSIYLNPEDSFTVLN